MPQLYLSVSLVCVCVCVRGRVSTRPQRYCDPASLVPFLRLLSGKRRSVVLAQPYALSRLESIKRKKTEGKCTLTEMIESPSAQNNGAFSFDEEEKVALVEENVDAPTGGIKGNIECQYALRADSIERT